MLTTTYVYLLIKIQFQTLEYNYSPQIFAKTINRLDHTIIEVASRFL